MEFVITFITLVAGVVTIIWFFRDMRRENSKMLKEILGVQERMEKGQIKQTEILEKIENGQEQSFKYLTDVIKETSKSLADVQNETSKYLADVIKETSKSLVDVQNETSKYLTDVIKETSKYLAELIVLEDKRTQEMLKSLQKSL